MLAVFMVIACAFAAPAPEANPEAKPQFAYTGFPMSYTYPTAYDTKPYLTYASTYPYLPSTYYSAAAPFAYTGLKTFF